MQLRNFRTKHNLTQVQLAKLLGVSEQAITKRERDSTVPNQMVLALLFITNIINDLPNTYDFEILYSKVCNERYRMEKRLEEG
jgi:transcriptional regulator with XRE-family HTH domain